MVIVMGMCVVVVLEREVLCQRGVWVSSTGAGERVVEAIARPSLTSAAWPLAHSESRSWLLAGGVRVVGAEAWTAAMAKQSGVLGCPQPRGRQMV